MAFAAIALIVVSAAILTLWDQGYRFLATTLAVVSILVFVCVAIWSVGHRVTAVVVGVVLLVTPLLLVDLNPFVRVAVSGLEVSPCEVETSTRTVVVSFTIANLIDGNLQFNGWQITEDNGRRVAGHARSRTENLIPAHASWQLVTQWTTDCEYHSYMITAWFGSLTYGASFELRPARYLD